MHGAAHRHLTSAATRDPEPFAAQGPRVALTTHSRASERRRVDEPAAGCTVRLARLSDLKDRHLTLLDPQEQARRSRFRGEEDRDRFALGAVLLRIAAALSTGGEAGAVTVDRTCDRCGRQHGRPRLPGSGVHASVSHSGDLVVVATSGAGPLGVDVERLGGPPSSELRASVCSRVEQASIRTPQDFFTYWVRKEAVLKATGEGLQRDMSEVEVAHPDSPPSLLSIVGRPTPPCSMSAITLEGYAGAVAVLTPSRIRFSFVDAAPGLRAHEGR